jgi:hypothetical protein
MSINALLKNLEEVKTPKPVVKKDEKKLSGYIGKVGGKITAEGRVLVAKHINGYYGTTLLLKIEDASGNLITTFYSGTANEVPVKGDTINISGTVKKHDVYFNSYTGNEEKSTILTRTKWYWPVDNSHNHMNSLTK